MDDHDPHQEPIKSAKDQSLPPAIWMQILSRLDLSQLSVIRQVSRLFNSAYLEVEQTQGRKIKCNLVNLPSEIWIHEIMSRLKRDDVKKIEVICSVFKNYVNEHPSLRRQLFRGQVINKSLLEAYEEWLKNPWLKSQSSHQSGSAKRLSAFSKLILNPNLTDSDNIEYCMSIDRSGHTWDDLYVKAFGKDLSGKFNIRRKNDAMLIRHPIGREAASEPAVGFFRFDFEPEDKFHRGSSERYPTANGKPKAVTVKDVVSRLLELKGGRNMAAWYRNKSVRFREEKSSTFVLEEGMRAKLIKKGNSVGIEISDADFRE